MKLFPGCWCFLRDRTMPLHQLNYDCFDLIYNELNTKAKISFLTTLTESKEYAPIISHLTSFPITIRAYELGWNNFIRSHKWFKDIDYSLHVYQIVQLLDNLDLLLDLKFDFNDNLSEDTYKSILNDKYYHNINSITLKNCPGNEFVFAKDSKWNSKVIELFTIYSDDSSQDLQLSSLPSLKKLHLHFNKAKRNLALQVLHLDELIITLDNNMPYDFLEADESHVPTGLISLSIPVHSSMDAMVALFKANCETLQSLTFSVEELFRSNENLVLSILQHIRKFPYLKQLKTNGYFNTSLLEGSNVDDVSMGVLNDKIFRSLDNDSTCAPGKICYDEDVEDDLGVFEEYPHGGNCPDTQLYDFSTKLKKLTINGLLFGPRDATRLINTEFPRLLEELEINFTNDPLHGMKVNGGWLAIPPRIKKLTLSNLRLFHPPDIPASTVYLDLSGNELRYYPDITRNERLFYLDLSGNGIKPSPVVTNNVDEGVVMESIDFLKNLKHFKIRTPRVEDKYIKNLKSLETLYIQSPDYELKSKEADQPELILPPNLKACKIELGDPKTKNWKWRICSEYPLLKVPDSLYELTIQLPEKTYISPMRFPYLNDLKIKILKFYANLNTTKENPLYLSDELEIFKSRSSMGTRIWFKFPPNSSTQLRSLSAYPFSFELDYLKFKFACKSEEDGVTHPHLDQREIYIHRSFEYRV